MVVEEVKENNTESGQALPSGALIHSQEPSNGQTRITVLEYNARGVEEVICHQPEDCFRFRNSSKISWINVDGIHDLEVLAKICNHFGLDELILEDIMNAQHRPKAEVFDNHLFIIMKMHGVNKDVTEIISEQLSLVMGKKFVITFQQYQGDVFNQFRARLKSNQTPARKNEEDYLLYKLMDTVVDTYFDILEHISEGAVKLENSIIESADDNALARIQRAKKRLVSIKRSIYPLREAIFELENDSGRMIGKRNQEVFKGCL